MELVIGWALAAFVIVVVFLCLLALLVVWAQAMAKGLLFLYVMYKALRYTRRHV